MERIVSLSMKRFISCLLVIIICFSITGCAEQAGSINAEMFVSAYESDVASGYSYVSDYSSDYLFEADKFLFEDLCFADSDVTDGISYDFTAASAACFDVDNAKVLYAKSIFDKIYPASTTKLLTAVVVAKYSNPDDIVTIREDNCGITTAGAMLCGFKAGDTITVRDLLYCLLVMSGNDAAIALAEHISGSVEKFAELMNSEAAGIGATDTHFNNPHGLHSPNHYTSAYDMYLIFREALSFPSLKEIMTSSAYTAIINGSDGEERYLTVESTNMYKRGLVSAPEGMTVLCGKTGETIAAGNCLIIYSEDESGHGYITELFKADDRTAVYKEMNILLELVAAGDSTH